MDRKAMYKLSYGLFILTAKEAEKDNGCIINTAIQAASEPNQLSICVNKANYTHDMIQRTGNFTIPKLLLEFIFSFSVTGYWFNNICLHQIGKMF